MFFHKHYTVLYCAQSIKGGLVPPIQIRHTMPSKIRNSSAIVEPPDLPTPRKNFPQKTYRPQLQSSNNHNPKTEVKQMTFQREHFPFTLICLIENVFSIFQNLRTHPKFPILKEFSSFEMCL